MELNHFNDFIGLFAAFNLGFAGFRLFRRAINNDILKLANKTNPKIEALQREIQIARMFLAFEKDSNPAYKEVDEKILVENKKIHEDHKEAIELIKIKSVEGNKISEGFKSIFLFTGFYCLILLIVSGYQDWWGISRTSSFVFLINISCLYNVFLFLRSFTRVKEKKIAPIIPLLLIVSLTILCGILVKTYIKVPLKYMPYNVALCLTISMSAYILFFIRLGIHLSIYKNKLKDNDLECAKRLEIQRDSIYASFLNKK